MLQIVLHSGVGELCVVVSRWFGCVKLGTGGLVRAYQDSVRENIALGDPTINDHLILRAASLAGVTDFLRNNPAGFAAQVGE